MAHHELVDVVVTSGDGTRQYLGRCRCGWESTPCNTSVHALALVEDHGRSSRLRSRRRLDRTAAPPEVTGPGDDTERTA